MFVSSSVTWPPEVWRTTEQIFIHKTDIEKQTLGCCCARGCVAKIQTEGGISCKLHLNTRRLRDFLLNIFSCQAQLRQRLTDLSYWVFYYD